MRHLGHLWRLGLQLLQIYAKRGQAKYDRSLGVNADGVLQRTGTFSQLVPTYPPAARTGSTTAR